MRAVSLAEASCGFSWTEDVKVNLLDHFLVGTGERYYHKQVDTWWEQQPSLKHVMSSCTSDDHGETGHKATHGKE